MRCSTGVEILNESSAAEMNSQAMSSTAKPQIGQS
jgi:hypothetical protein